MKLTLESDIKPFLEALNACVNKSHFDLNILQEYTAEALYKLDRQQWISLYQTRTVALKSTEFSWITKSRTVNRLWLSFARKIECAFSIGILDLIFPSELIDQKDKDSIKCHYDFTDLYEDDKGNLRSFCRFVTSFEPGNKPYDEGYKLSLYEAEQIKAHCDWEYFCENILPIWCDDTLNDSFKDSVYPIFECVTSYFSMIETPISEQNSLANRELINALIAKVYTKELIHLDPAILYVFYAKKIEISEYCEMEMIQVLLACRGYQTLHDRLPYMTALAKWVGAHNPAMIIQHAALNPVYQSLGIGPYCSRARLRLEINKLLQPNYAHELDNKIRQMIENLSLLLAQTLTTDEQIFNAMQELNRKFDAHNGKPKGARRQSLTTNDYVHNQHGINAQIIFINQLLSGWGFLEQYGVSCYYRFMMNLDSDVDPISAKLYSHFPLSHCVRPDDDRRYLAILDNSVDCFGVTEGVFENVNANPQRPFTEDEYNNIQRFSAVQFRLPKYKRIAEYPVPPIKKSYLTMFTCLVNASLDFRGLIDGYRLDTVWEEFPPAGAHEDGVIYIKIRKESLKYSVKDRWTIDSEKKIYRGFIPTYDAKSKCDFFTLIRDEDRLRYILCYTGPSQHTRPNYEEEQLTRSAYAYTQVKQQVDQMPEVDKLSLFGTRIRLGNEIVTIGDLWADGFPECMTYASKGFAVFLLTYFRGKIQFDKKVESQSIAIGKNFIEEQRKIAQARTSVATIIDDTIDISLNNFSIFKTRFTKEELQLAILSDPSETESKISSTSSSRQSSVSSQTDVDSISGYSAEVYELNTRRLVGSSSLAALSDLTDCEEIVRRKNS